MGADKSLRLWDLTKGRPAFTTTLKSEPLGVKWSDDGSAYAVLYEGAVLVHDGATGAQTATLAAPSGVRLCDMAVFSASVGGSLSTVIAAGCEGGDLRLWDAKGTWCRTLATGHAKRVRCVAYTDAVKSLAPNSHAVADDSAPSVDLHPLSKMTSAASARVTLTSDGPFLVTVDSECVVKLWPVHDLLKAAGSKASSVSISSSSSSSSRGIPETKIEGVAAAATLSTGSSARATALVASRSRAFVQSEMKGHKQSSGGGTSTSAAAGSSNNGAASNVKQQQKNMPAGPSNSASGGDKQQAGKKRQRPVEDGAGASSAVSSAQPQQPKKQKKKEKAAQAQAASTSSGSASASVSDGKDQPKPSKGGAAFSFGFKVNFKDKHSAPPPAAPATESAIAAAPKPSAAAKTADSSGPVAAAEKKAGKKEGKKPGVRFNL